MSVNRCYSEKKPGFDVEARSLFSSLHDLLEIKNLTHVRYLCRYDAEGLSGETYEKAKGIVFSEPMADVCYDEDFPRPAGAHTVLAVEPLPGQFDQRADSCAQCIQLLTGGERPTVAAAKIYVLEGELTADGHGQDPRLPHQPGREPGGFHGQARDPQGQSYAIPTSVGVRCGLHRTWTRPRLSDMLHQHGSGHGPGRPQVPPDLLPRRREPRPHHHRDPAWSTPTGPTTAATPPSSPRSTTWRSSDPMVQGGLSSATWPRASRSTARRRPQSARSTLMDMAHHRRQGAQEARAILKNLDESEEINACSIKVKAHVDGQ